MCAPPSASVEDLKHAFREFALRHHPDKAPQGTGAMYARARVSLKLKALSYFCASVVQVHDDARGTGQPRQRPCKL